MREERLDYLVDRLFPKLREALEVEALDLVRDSHPMSLVRERYDLTLPFASLLL